MSKVSYDPETGIFTWAETKRRGFIGKKAGCFCPRDGYIRIRINGKLELAHRLAWDICNPDNKLTPQEQIDHINHIRTGNRICNLRKLFTDFMKTTEKPREHHSPDPSIAKTYQGTRGRGSTTTTTERCR